MLHGGAGSDFLGGREGDDTLAGGTENDFLFGGAGSDDLYGEKGDDLLCGGLNPWGGSPDTFDGGLGEDTYSCRSAASAEPPFDPELDTGNPSTEDSTSDCEERPAYPGDRSLESTEDPDPYLEWVRRFERSIDHGSRGTGAVWDIEFATTSSTDLMLDAIAGGATILLEEPGVPLHSYRVQSYHTCGPQSLEMVLRHRGLQEYPPEPQAQLLFLRDVSSYSWGGWRWDVTPFFPAAGYWDPSSGGDNEDEVSVGYRYSAEHIVLDALFHRWWFDHDQWPPRGPCNPPDAYLVPGTDLLANGDGRRGSHFRIPYMIGGYDPSQEIIPPLGEGPPQGEGPLQLWDQCSPGVGINVGDEDAPWGGRMLAGVANRASAGSGGSMDAEVISNDMLVSAAHFRAVVVGFVSHDLPLLVGVERGGHFNAVVGYWDRGTVFYVYTADPLDGALRPYDRKPMRWQRFALTQALLDSHVLTGALLFGHVDGGCEPNGWAEVIDDTFAPLLCD